MENSSIKSESRKTPRKNNDNGLDEIRGIIAATTLNKNAKQILKNLLEQIKEHDTEIKNAKYKQIIEETTLERKYGSEQAIVLEWGEKIKPTENEKELLTKRSKFRRFLSILTFSIFDKEVPNMIIYSNYKFICFHLNSYQIVFPHNPTFSPINIENFVANPKIIYSNIAAALKNPNSNKKTLSIGKDY